MISVPTRVFSRLTALALTAATFIPATSAVPYKPAIYDEAKVVNHPLPDPLVFNDGSPVRDVATWRSRRRAELLELFSREVYGRTPSDRPKAMHFETTSVDRTALGGKATRKEVTVHFTAAPDGPQMHVLIYQPNRAPTTTAAAAATSTNSALAPRWPVFLGLNYFGNQCVHADPGITLSRAWMRTNAEFGIVDHRATERTRGVHASRWDIETVIARGYATATIYYGEIGADNNEGLQDPTGAMLRSGSAMGRRPDGWGLIGLWAWGLSRALDYIETDAELDAKRVAIHGHSRLGKTALWAAVQDERFALVISNNSGCGGAALSKRVYGETVAVINANYLPWFAHNFKKYDDNEADLPVDQHELLALIAPRPLYVASASEDRGADPLGEFLALKHAEPVYRLHGKGGLGVTEFPAVDTPVGDTIGYHVRTGKHDITPYDWAQYLNFADKHLGSGGRP